jgi:phosphoribosylformimino-5-aminoimidazole carboxamide ribotide isomerase
MIAIPIIELRNGACVKPTGAAAGDFPSGEALAVLRALAALGFHRVQINDRDSEAGAGSNTALIEDLVRDGAIDIQVAGGVRSLDQVERLSDAGACRVVLAPRALDEPEWLAHIADLFPGLLIVATDVRERRVVTRGWVRGLPLDILDLAEDLGGIPLGGLLVSSDHRDEQRTCGDLTLLEDVAEACECPVIVSGGVATMDDLRALEHRGVAAAVLGTVLSSGALELPMLGREFGGRN